MFTRLCDMLTCLCLRVYVFTCVRSPCVLYVHVYGCVRMYVYMCTCTCTYLYVFFVNGHCSRAYITQDVGNVDPPECTYIRSKCLQDARQIDVQREGNPSRCTSTHTSQSIPRIQARARTYLHTHDPHTHQKYAEIRVMALMSRAPGQSRSLCGSGCALKLKVHGGACGSTSGCRRLRASRCSGARGRGLQRQRSSARTAPIACSRPTHVARDLPLCE